LDNLKYGDRLFESREIPNLDGRPYFCIVELSKETGNFHGRKISVFKETGTVFFETFFEGVKEVDNYYTLKLKSGMLYAGNKTLTHRCLLPEAQLF